jgi:glycerophosphoryl diester phosphodiesterase
MGGTMMGTMSRSSPLATSPGKAAIATLPRVAVLARIAILAILAIFAIFATSCASGRGAAGKETNMDTKAGPLVIAHRGFRGVAPENTIMAAAKGYEAGADLWELDVAATKDGALVVLHDDNLVRTTDAKTVFPERNPWTVYDFSLEELKRLDAGSWYAQTDPFGQIASGRVSRAELASFKGLRVPTLEESLLFTKEKRWKVNIEIKDATGFSCDEWIVERTVGLVQKLGMVESVLISSFNHAYLERVRRAEPGIPTGALVSAAPADPVALLAKLGAYSYNPSIRGLKKETVAAVRTAGYEVYVWTVNNEEDIRRMIDWGVSGIITDFPPAVFDLMKKEK